MIQLKKTFRFYENGIDADIHLGYEDYYNPVKIAETIATAKSQPFIDAHPLNVARFLIQFRTTVARFSI